jgi:hypothetical protein
LPARDLVIRHWSFVRKFKSIRQDGQPDANTATNMATEKAQNPRKLSNAVKMVTVRKRPTTWLRQPTLFGGRADRVIGGGRRQTPRLKKRGKLANSFFSEHNSPCHSGLWMKLSLPTVVSWTP